MIPNQTTDTVIMVAPTEFSANPEASADNHFVDSDASFKKATILMEASQLKNTLVTAGVNVIDIDPSVMVQPPNSPDGCFPNNWLMFVDGKSIICPMKATSRRSERAMWQVIASRLHAEGLCVSDVIDMSAWEMDDLFLEGTGSLVLDRVNRIAYAALSERTIKSAAEKAAETLGYELVAFAASDPHGRPIYHTNVILSIGTNFAVVCLDAISADWRPIVRDSIAANRTIVEIKWEQVLNYCGNVLELKTKTGEGVVAMSKTACKAFTLDELANFRSCGGTPIYADVSTIERVAGGSVRCMLAEVFLTR